MPESLPAFYRDAAHREQIQAKIKLIQCPACGRCDFLIFNGLLFGNDPRGRSDRRVERGQRVFCSNRGGRGGCGRSCSIRPGDALPHRGMDSQQLGVFLKAILDCAGCVHRAWQAGSRLFSLSTAYRLWRQIGLAQPTLRPQLCQCAGPPASAARDPRLQLVGHLRRAFPAEDPIAAFQIHFQAPWLPRF